MATLNLVSPWIDHYHKLQAFFKYDEDVNVVFDQDEMEVRLYVYGEEKAAALDKLLIKTYKFGKTTLKIAVIPANDIRVRGRYPWRSNAGNHTSSETQELFETALGRNKAFCFSHVVSGVLTNDLVYIVFANEVVQYYTDDLGDYFGQCSTLYQNIALDIFNDIPGVHYCTNMPPYEN